MLIMSDVLIALKSTVKSYTFPFKDTSLESTAPHPLDMFLDKIGSES